VFTGVLLLVNETFCFPHSLSPPALFSTLDVISVDCFVKSLQFGSSFFTKPFLSPSLVKRALRPRLFGTVPPKFVFPPRVLPFPPVEQLPLWSLWFLPSPS